MSEHRERILASLEPMFQEAEEKGLVFRSDYQGIIMTPSELRKQHENGSFIWGPANWKLIDPRDLIDSMERSLEQKRMEIENEKKRFGIV